MDPVSLILTALATGAAKSASDAASSVVKDVYNKFRDTLKEHFMGKPAASHAIDQYIEDPEGWKNNAENELRVSRAGENDMLVDLAYRLLAVADPEGTLGGKYSIDLRGSQGAQVGDHNKQTNYFTPRGPHSSE